MKKELKKESGDKKKLKKTLIFVFILSLIGIFSAILVQLNGEEKITNCSYLDPVLIDILAFLIALFLVIEGFSRIFEHPHASLKRQFTRMLRIVIGFCILTLHAMQFMYK